MYCRLSLVRIRRIYTEAHKLTPPLPTQPLLILDIYEILLFHQTINSLQITTPEESPKCKERQLLGREAVRKHSLGFEEKRVAENAHSLGFGPYSKPSLSSLSHQIWPIGHGILSLFTY